MVLLIAAMLAFTLIGVLAGSRFGARELFLVGALALTMTILYAVLPNRLL
jgi:hypothetical protein